MHTEEEAQRLICPLLPGLPGAEVRSCLAGRCALWRWQPSLTVENPSRVPGAATQRIEHKTGYCGLAGKS